MLKAGLRHPKTYDLASRLEVPRAQAIGILDLMWDYAAEVAPQGDIGKWPDAAIAGACDWTGDPAEFVQALVDAGWLDRDEKHRLLIHHWNDHAQNFVRAKLKKAGLPFLSGDLSADLRGDSSSKPFKAPQSPTEEGSERSSSLPAIPLKDGTERRIPEAWMHEWAVEYPRMDILAELKAARRWCVNNPAKRKTSRGLKRFLGGWLERAWKESRDKRGSGGSKGELPC